MNRKSRESEQGKDYRVLVLLVLGLAICIFRLSREGPEKLEKETCPPSEIYLWLESPQLPRGLYRFPDRLTWSELYTLSGITALPGNANLALIAPAPLSTIQLSEHLGPTISGPHPSMTPFFFMPVPLNSADAELIATLPDIGLRLAERIVEHRSRFGRFNKPEDLLTVDGIGRGKMEKIKSLVSF